MKPVLAAIQDIQAKIDLAGAEFLKCWHVVKWAGAGRLDQIKDRLDLFRSAGQVMDKILSFSAVLRRSTEGAQLL